MDSLSVSFLVNIIKNRVLKFCVARARNQLTKSRVRAPDAFVGVLTVVLGMAAKYLRDTVRQHSDSALLQRLADVATDVVVETYRTSVRTLREAGKDGHLSKDDGQRVKQQVVDTVLNAMGSKARDELRRVFGDGTVKRVSALVETAVHREKERGGS